MVHSKPQDVSHNLLFVILFIYCGFFILWTQHVSTNPFLFSVFWLLHALQRGAPCTLLCKSSKCVITQQHRSLFFLLCIRFTYLVTKNKHTPISASCKSLAYVSHTSKPYNASNLFFCSYVFLILIERNIYTHHDVEDKASSLNKKITLKLSVIFLWCFRERKKKMDR